ncbi:MULTISPECIES: PTS ascorbate transporter subunit IIC [Thermoanaerobacter]|uniref:Ascorbate-specific PTS system EIIC component n=2 Tax=Thermoanaerobacter TaxID=1754 RepID=B0KD89_THEP3|nr:MULTISPECIES: PTS ascorbate transporter subunit IIC [Thermoanaerobacter]ABY91556.1 putative sugar-specific permease, SgaT/UlaA [Thermoanaerobacter sp. X514]ABY95608.1 putative sugar-specific permease, SgaT/UlaA [Thermoanaerobacter pseudethanolicus ATCC 33223]ADV80546.1 PTS system ascorbate-specific transporter subunit IIC [Thermoanaerobacter brockii subsp. finnii Ako-1]HBW60299.1 PTS ascorbate transporter subunit IIC [Thermoanaerobacter sp.]
MALIDFLVKNLFNQVSVLIGLVTLIGLLLQKKSFQDTISGTIKAMVGILIMLAGTDVFIAGLVSFQTIVSSAFHISAPVAKNTLQNFTNNFGSIAVSIMALGFLIHLIIVKLFNTKFVYLTGHLMWWISLVITASLLEVFPNINQGTLILTGAILIALYWTFQPVYLHKYMRKVTNSDEIGYGHTSSIAAYLAGCFGHLFGRPEESTEKVNIPKKIEFMKDITVGTAFIITIIMLVASFFAEREVVLKQAGDLNFVIWAIIQGFKFAAGITILLYGVRLFLAEIVPAFRGISQKLIPGAKPALDVPVVFPYAPTAVLIGFISSTLVFLLFMIIFGLTGFATIVPSMIMLFFPAAGAAVFGNAVGGWKGAVFGGAINGLFLAFGQALTWPMLSNTAPELAVLADPDWYIIMWLIIGIGKLIKLVF